MTALQIALLALSRAFSRLAAVVLLVMTGMVILASFMRYLVGAPFHFTEEVVALLYLSTVFLALPACAIRRQHIMVGILTDRVGGEARRWLAFVAIAVMIAFCGWFGYATLEFTLFSREIEARSEQVEILLWPWMAILPATMLLLVAIELLHVVRLARRMPDETPTQAPVGDAL